MSGNVGSGSIQLCSYADDVVIIPTIWTALKDMFEKLYINHLREGYVLMKVKLNTWKLAEEILIIMTTTAEYTVHSVMVKLNHIIQMANHFTMIHTGTKSCHLNW